MPAISLNFGEGRENWQPRLRTQSAIAVPLAMAPLLAALVQMSQPERALSFVDAPIAVLVIGAALFAIGAILGSAAWLLWQKKAAGVVMFGAGLTYVSPMICALAVAIVPMSSGGMICATLALIVWSLWRLIRTNRDIKDTEIAQLAKERIRISGDGPVLLPSSAFPADNVLNRLQARQTGGVMFILELAAALLVVLTAPLSMPLAIVGIPQEVEYGSALIWFLCVAVFLDARKPVNGLILQWRAMRQSAP